MKHLDLVGRNACGQMAVASLTGILPVYLIGLFAQRFLIGGLTAGSIKG